MPGADRLVHDLEARVRPLEVELAGAWWEANTHSSPEADRRRAELELAHRELLADPDLYAELGAARAEADGDPFVARQVELMYDACTPNQVPEHLRRRIVELETTADSVFANFRGTIADRSVDDNQIIEILRRSDDATQRRAAWEASKQVGAEVAPTVRELARARNEAARALGHRDHFALALATSELDEGRLFATLDAVDRATGDLFAQWKAGVDAGLATRFGCRADELAPWHYDDPFLQEPPLAGAVDLDDVFAELDLEALTTRTYDGLGLELRPVLARSDLYGRAGKSQHAFCIDIDREGDVRVLCNLRPTARWMDTMLHEFGHAAYDANLRRDVPWLLRVAAHPITTEAVAMLMGRQHRDADWLREIAQLAPSDVTALAPRLAGARRAALLTFARWVLVMTTFERSLYADPDADLDARWWDLVERFQLVRRPAGRSAPDWAAKIHLAVAPVYYQNYLLGELLASQLNGTLHARAGGIVERPEAGAWLARELFGPGSTMRWDRLVERATGAPLSPAAFASQLVGDGRA
jgi:peptidyl-dipeptidase A